MPWGAELEKQHALNQLEREWGDIRKDVLINFGPETNRKIPKFVQRFSRQLFEAKDELRRSLMTGDMAWFIAWSMRFDQMENALIEIGFDPEKRMPITRARWLLQRLVALAKHRLKELGGEWPPKPIDASLPLRIS